MLWWGSKLCTIAILDQLSKLLDFAPERNYEQMFFQLWARLFTSGLIWVHVWGYVRWHSSVGKSGISVRRKLSGLKQGNDSVSGLCEHFYSIHTVHWQCVIVSLAQSNDQLVMKCPRSSSKDFVCLRTLFDLALEGLALPLLTIASLSALLQNFSSSSGTKL